MTATAAPPPTASMPAPPGSTDEVGNEQDGPGRLRIDPRVVQKLAARAANEVHGVSRATAAPLGRAIHRPVPAGTPADQLAIDLHLAVTIRYPLSLRLVVEQLAAHVSMRVEQLTGRPAGHVSVTVQRLGGNDAGPARPRVR